MTQLALFISDLHLDPDSPAIARQFLEFLDGEARTAEALAQVQEIDLARTFTRQNLVLPQPSEEAIARIMQSLAVIDRPVRQATVRRGKG